MQYIKTDVLIIGSGAAGLMLSYSLSQKTPGREILVLTKDDVSESNTRYAQGGIAVVSDLLKDSFESHINDTLIAGDYHNDPDVVKRIIETAPAVMDKIYKLGLNFDENDPGFPDLGREGGHSENRIVHYRDHTGYELSRVLVEKVNALSNVSLKRNSYVVELLVSEDAGGKTAYGVIMLDDASGELQIVEADHIVMATGGAGMVYQTTTNPDVATGDSIAMAYLAGAKLKDLEFIQFHPTSLFSGTADQSNAFLITEALRGFGAVLRNSKGQQFMKLYDERADLACRDVVARAVYEQMSNHGDDCVYLDCTHLDQDELKIKFPVIFDKCVSIGVDPAKEGIPVRPAAHYICGGIAVDEKGRSNIKNLYACGECSRTGFHGANRLASNSLLEALVYADWIADDIASFPAKEKIQKGKFKLPDMKHSDSFPDNDWIRENKNKLRQMMDQKAGIIRNREDLRLLRDELKIMHRLLLSQVNGYVTNKEFYELRNMLLTAGLIIDHSLLREENKGVYFNTDLVRTS